MLHPKILQLAPSVRPRVFWCVAAGLAIAAAAIARGFLLADVMDKVFQNQAVSLLVLPLVWVGGLVLLQACLQWAKRWCELWVAAGIKIHLRNRLLEKLYQLGPSYTLNQGSHQATSSSVDGVEAMEGYFSRYLPQVFITALVPGMILVYLFFLDVWVALLVLVSIAVALFAPKLWERLLGTYGSEHWDAYSQLNQSFVNSMQGMTTLQAFNAAERSGRELKKASQTLYRNTMKQLAVSMLSTGIVNLAMKAGSALALGLAAIRTAQGHMDFESLLVTLFLVAECVRPLSDLDQAWHAGYMGISAATGIQTILEEKPNSTSGSTCSLPTMTTPPEIHIHNLHFTYPGKKQAVFHNLQLTLPAGKTTALVGPSGSGKTTLVSLLLRFYDPNEGSITIDLHPLRDLHPTVARSLFSVVSQDTYLFYGTAAENLRIAKPDASQADLEAAAKAANIHEFLTGLPEGYETLVGERGLALSGGQRQRLALARAFLKDAPVLILDEATASVDAANEKDIQMALRAIARDRTTLIIAHRMNTLVDADQILFLENGAIQEAGTHAQLLEKHGNYARFFSLQAVSS